MTLLVIGADARRLPARVIERIRFTAARFPGNDQIKIRLTMSVGVRELSLGPTVRVDAWDPDLVAALEALGFELLAR